MSVDFNPETHEYTVGGRVRPSVTQILKKTGFIDTRWFKPSDAQRGSTIHELLHLYDDDLLDPNIVQAEYRGYLDAYMDFLAVAQVEYSEIEHPVFSQKYKFAGTPDRVGRFNESPCIIDIKTGAKARWHGLQLAGYSLAVGNGHDLIGVYLTKEAKWSIKRFEGSLYAEGFMAALVCYKIQTMRGAI